VRRSSSGQDAAPSSAETAVRVRPRRSIVKSLDVRSVPLRAVRNLIEREHYTHSTPAAASRAFGVYLHGELHGAAVLFNGAARSSSVLFGAGPGDVVTLSRLWLSDDLPKNAESRVLGVIVRVLRRERRYKALVTFADPAVGHDGAIYRAAGFTYLGTTNAETSFLIDGKACHSRTVASSYGSSDVEHLRRTGIDARRVRALPKHRYVAVLDQSWRWRLGAAEHLRSIAGGESGIVTKE
jgi:hypothetical protein